MPNVSMLPKLYYKRRLCKKLWFKERVRRNIYIYIYNLKRKKPNKRVREGDNSKLKLYR